MRVRQPLHGVTGAWHVTILILAINMHTLSILPMAFVLGWLISADLRVAVIGIRVD